MIVDHRNNERNSHGTASIIIIYMNVREEAIEMSSLRSFFAVDKGGIE